MKKIAVLLILFMLVTSLFGCDRAEEHGLESSMTAPPEGSSESITEETPESTEKKLHLIPADWGDYIKLNGLTYIGDWRVTEVTEDRIGEKICEVTSGPPDVYCDDEGNIYNDIPPNGSAGWCHMGTEVFSVIDSDRSVAALVDGKYYLYTAKLPSSTKN